MTFSSQIERERQHQRAQQPDCCISSSDDESDRSDEDEDLNIYRSPAYPIRHTSRLARTARRPLTTRTGLQVNWAIRAHPSASALEVAEQISHRYHLMDSPQVHPLDAVYWADTQELILPPVVMLPTHYRDLRRGLWEPRQPTRFVPVIHGTHILCDIAISMHTDPAELIRRVEAMRMEPPRVHLAVFPPHIWVLFLSHADPVPPLVRARGGMRPMPGATHHTLSSSLGSSGTTPTSLSWSIDRVGQPYSTNMNFIQAEQAHPTQLVKIMLPAQAPREVLMTTNVDMEEEDILRQAAHRFALPPTRVTLKGVVPLERLQHGDTLILPIKVKFPFMETRNSRIVSFTWMRRPMSKAEYFIPASWSIQRMHQVLMEANHLHPHSLTVYWQGIPLHHEGQTKLESFLPPPAFDLEVTAVETYTLLPTEDQMHHRGGASRGRRTSHRRTEEAQQRSQMQGPEVAQP